METETQEQGLVTIRNDVGGHLVVTKDRLQQIVQAAYDVHGILATPSWEAEAERAPGLCRCGQAGCSDAALQTAHNVGARA